MKKPQFTNDTIYHVYNRGVEKRTIYIDQQDYFRFIHDLYEFNDEISAENLYYKREALKSYEVQPRKILQRKILVEIGAFCLMQNHFHVLLRQRQEGGVIKFMQKLGTGYTMYFNKKYQRVGPLFQGRFKAVLIEKQEHFQYLPHYIHLNPLPQHDEQKQDIKKILRLLGSYRWSSYLDYTGKKNFSSILSKNLIKELQGNGTPKEYKESLIEWLHDIKISESTEAVFKNYGLLRGLLRG